MTDKALSRLKTVFVVPEVTRGVMTMPSASDVVFAVSAEMSQTRKSKNSEELIGTLDVIDKVVGSANPAKLSLKTYIRPNGLGNAPMGDGLFQSAIGSKATAFTAALNAGINSAVTSLTYKNLAGEIPACGTIEIGTETIFYGTLTRTTSTTGTLSALVRGYNGTTAASHDADDVITFNGIFYKQTTQPPDVTVIVKGDVVTQYMRGGVVDSLKLGTKKEDFVEADWSVQGREMLWAGESPITATAGAAAAATIIDVDNAAKFKVGAPIYNSTINDAGSLSTGYIITDSDYATNKLTLAEGIQNTSGWSYQDKIEGWAPDVGTLGDFLAGRYTEFVISGLTTPARQADISYACKRKEISDEMDGTSYPTDFVPEMVEGSLDVKVYQNADNVSLLGTVDDGEEVTARVAYGSLDGHKMYCNINRLYLSEVNFKDEPPLVSVDMKGTMLGLKADTAKGIAAGENSFEIVFC